MQNTKHGEQRLKERTGNSKKNTRILQLALERGLRHKDTKGQLSKYITKLFFKNKTACNVRVYQGKVFLFTRDETLITVLELPKNLTKQALDTCRVEDGADAI